MSNDILKELKEKFYKKKVLVVGLGLQGGGVGLVNFFCRLGAKVTVTDLKTKEQLKNSIVKIKNLNVKLVLGRHRLRDFLEADIIFKGPAVPWNLPEIIEAEKRGISIEMELSFFASFCRGSLIGITGTRGKSTTTYLIYQILKDSGFKVRLAGSIPNVSTISFLKQLRKDDWVVMELPSWPLSGFHRRKISPHIAVFTNFYPDHLNYYKTMDEYLYDKKAIYLYQRPGDYLVINKKLLPIIKLDHYRGILSSFTDSDFSYDLNYLKGKHNRENAAAALAVAKILKINKKKAIKTISNLRGLVFREEIVGRKDNVIFINDTTSTTPIATIKAIERFSDKPIYLILGGNSKNLPFNNLIKCLIKTKKIVLLEGSFTQEILPVLKQKYSEKILGPYNDLKMAVKEGFRLGGLEKRQAYLLFSPAATSFSMFNNEFHRGKEFNTIVKEIVEN